MSTHSHTNLIYAIHPSTSVRQKHHREVANGYEPSIGLYPVTAEAFAGEESLGTVKG